LDRRHELGDLCKLGARKRSWRGHGPCEASNLRSAHVVVRQVATDRAAGPERAKPVTALALGEKQRPPVGVPDGRLGRPVDVARRLSSTGRQAKEQHRRKTDADERCGQASRRTEEERHGGGRSVSRLGSARSRREEQALERFNESIRLYARLQDAGRIESFDVALLNPTEATPRVGRAVVPAPRHARKRAQVGSSSASRPQPSWGRPMAASLVLPHAPMPSAAVR
jgi:hypothetical protein